MANKFKPGDRIRIRVLDRYVWGDSNFKMQEIKHNRTICTVSEKYYPNGVYLEEIGEYWVIHQDEIEPATIKPTIIIME